jgi:hypothetical protein
VGFTKSRGDELSTGCYRLKTTRFGRWCEQRQHLIGRHEHLIGHSVMTAGATRRPHTPAATPRPSPKSASRLEPGK